MANAAAISDMARHCFFDRPVTSGELESGSCVGLFHGLPEELQVTDIMAAIKMAPATRAVNQQALERQRVAKQEKEKLLKEADMETATDQYIECLIYHRMWISKRCWKTPTKVRAGVRALEFKKDKEEALKDNIRIRWLGMGWVEEAETSWSENGVKKQSQI